MEYLNFLDLGVLTW